MPKIEDFTEREKEIILLMCDGLSNEEIATELRLSIHTVRNNVATIRRVLKAKSRVEAVTTLFHTGLVKSR